MVQLRDIGLFLLIQILFGSTFPAVKAGLEFLPPLFFAAVRFVTAGCLLVGYMRVTGQEWRPRVRDDWTAVLTSGILFFGVSGLLYIGQQFTTSGVAGIIYSMIPIMTVVVAWLILPNERLSVRGMVGVLVSFVGVAIVVLPNPSNFGTTLVGEGLVLLAAISATLGTVFLRKIAASMSNVTLTGWSMLIGGGIQYGFSVLQGESLAIAAFTPTAFVLLCYLVVLPSAVGYVIYFDLIARFGPVEINLSSYLVPVVAVVLGWVFLDEQVTSLTFVGFLVIVTGFILIKYRELTAELAHFRVFGS
ncbi:DMT family transporter [Haladaptatus sp. CMAA 1911]|uniref:DMT family transporter n=1 Tax=unclassified Haladaptatus TaxID=2622732 RepID=UPI0037548094